MENNEFNNELNGIENITDAEIVADEELTAPVKKKGKKAAIIISVSVFAVLVAVGITLFFIFSKKDKNDTPSEASGITSSAAEETGDSSDVNNQSASATESKQDGKNQSVSATEGSDSKNNQSSSVSATASGNKGNAQNTASSGATSTGTANINLSQAPDVTVCTQVAPETYVIAGSCPKTTEYVIAKGNNITETKIVPFAGKTKSYFTSQIRFSGDGYIDICVKEKNKELSEPDEQYLFNDYSITENYMTKGEYTPVFGKNSQMHFYSALLSYSLSSDVIEPLRAEAESNISSIVARGNSLGAKTIFLIIPSSAEVYPETVPDGFNKTRKGTSIFEAFKSIAEKAGAEVIYPLETMSKHKNDGEGYQLYQHTDSHWSAYGAYWGTYDLFQKVSKPRTVAEMGFYTAELCGGDAMFNIPKDKVSGFEKSNASGLTSVTKIKELTTLYKLAMPTSTLKKVYHNNVGLYLTNDNKDAATVHNPKGSGLPTALIMRDSFGKVAYDIFNDRFSTVCWGEFDNYNWPTAELNKNGITNLNYVIYLYSERNLTKIMLNDSKANLLSFIG